MHAHISIKLFATLSKFTPESSDNYPITSGLTVRELLKILGVEEKDAKLIFINNKKGELLSSLKNGDRVGIFPPIGGG